MLSLTVGITDEHMTEVYADPGVQKCGHDLAKPKPVHHHLATYLSAWVDGVFAGAYLAIRYSAFEIELHSLLLKHAVLRSRELSRLAVSWCFDQGVMRVTALIYEGLEKTVNLCLKLGFKREGFMRDVCVIDGDPRGAHILGVTRKDWGMK